MIGEKMGVSPQNSPDHKRVQFPREEFGQGFRGKGAKIEFLIWERKDLKIPFVNQDMNDGTTPGMGNLHLYFEWISVAHDQHMGI